MSLFTVLGASGFIGSHLVKHLQKEGLECFAPVKSADLSGQDLGNVIYCIGLSADFRTRPFETIEAHVCCLIDMLIRYKFDSFVYLSSARVYGSTEGAACEEDVIHSQPLVPGDLYNISKIMGESACFATGNDNVKVVRLSNVYGYDSQSENFVFSLIRDALYNRKILLNTTRDSEKDHINVADVVRILPQIAARGRYSIYNIASGKNIAAGQIVDKLSELTGCKVEVASNAQKICFPKISIKRIEEEFSFQSSSIIDDLAELVTVYKKSRKD